MKHSGKLGFGINGLALSVKGKQKGLPDGQPFLSFLGPGRPKEVGV
jgi:hypothetical protein